MTYSINAKKTAGGKKVNSDLNLTKPLRLSVASDMKKKRVQFGVALISFIPRYFS